MSGAVQPPADAAALFQILNSRVFSGAGSGYGEYGGVGAYESAYNEGYDGRRDDYGNRGGVRSFATGDGSSSSSRQPPQTRDRRSTINDGDPAYWDRHRADPGNTFDRIDQSRSSQFQQRHFTSTYSDNPSSPTTPTMSGPPGRPFAPKPVFKPVTKREELAENQAVALYTFQSTQEGDLGKCGWFFFLWCCSGAVAKCGC